MASLSLLGCLTLIGVPMNLPVSKINAGVFSSTESNCSYSSLLDHLQVSQHGGLLASTRPVRTWSTPTLVKADMFVLGIIDVNEKRQSFTSLIIVAIAWDNEFLTWDQKAFCGIPMITVPMQKLWRPDLTIQEDISETNSATSGPHLLVYPGHTQILRRQIVTTSCPMDLYKFPFDTQSCTYTFQSNMYTVRDLRLGVYVGIDDLKKFTKYAISSPGEWEFLDIVMTESNVTLGQNTWDQLIYRITIKRRPLLYFVNLIIPIAFFLILDLMSFFISGSPGEKVNFKITLLLSISVLLLILKDIMPSAYWLPVIAVYCISIFTLVGISLLETMLVSFLADLDGKAGRDPRTCHMASALEKNQEDIGGERGDMAMTQDPTEASPGKRAPDGVRLSLSDPRVLKLVLEEVRRVRLEGSSAAGGGDQGKPGYWERVARRIDIGYFCLYLVTTTVFLVYIFVQWS